MRPKHLHEIANFQWRNFLSYLIFSWKIIKKDVKTLIQYILIFLMFYGTLSDTWRMSMKNIHGFLHYFFSNFTFFSCKKIFYENIGLSKQFSW